MHDQAFAYGEDLSDKGFIIATYYLELPAKTDLIAKSASFAVGQSLGTWTDVPGITREMLEHHLARIVAVYDLPPI